MGIEIVNPKAKKKDKTQPIFDAPDCDDLLNWLRHQPLLVYPNDHTVMVHAGIPPHWTISQAASYARELETQLQSSLWQLDRLLPNLYSDSSLPWSDALTGYARMRAICNYFTRMRLCQSDGTLEFSLSIAVTDDYVAKTYTKGDLSYGMHAVIYENGDLSIGVNDSATDALSLYKNTDAAKDSNFISKMEKQLVIENGKVVKKP